MYKIRLTASTAKGESEKSETIEITTDRNGFFFIFKNKLLI